MIQSWYISIYFWRYCTGYIKNSRVPIMVTRTVYIYIYTHMYTFIYTSTRCKLIPRNTFSIDITMHHSLHKHTVLKAHLRSSKGHRHCMSDSVTHHQQLDGCIKQLDIWTKINAMTTQRRVRILVLMWLTDNRGGVGEAADGPGVSVGRGWVWQAALGPGNCVHSMLEDAQQQQPQHQQRKQVSRHR